MYVLFRILFLFAWLGLASFLQAQVVDELIDPLSLEITGGQVVVIFDDARSNANPNKTNFEVQHSSDISRWTGIPTAVVSNVGNRYTLTADEPAGEERKFYRVIRYSTTAEDSDGDGLSDAFEADTERPLADRTDSNKVDSDFDGFSDSIEFAAGTAPNDASLGNFPSRAALPSVQFAEVIVDGIRKPMSQATEGQSTKHKILLEAEGLVSGTLSVSYSVNTDRSTATAPEDFVALSGSVDVTASGGEIEIDLVDDLLIKSERILILELAPNGGANYRTGGRTTHLVCISENDCCWSGALKDTFAARNFRMRLLRDGSTTQAAFIAGSADGLLKPDGDASSQSEGIIPITPKNIWNATGTDGPTQFMVTSESMSATAGGAFGSVSGLSRVLMLNAQPGAERPHHFIHANRYTGDYTETLTSAASPHLDRTMTGKFVLIKDIPAPAPGLLR